MEPVFSASIITCLEKKFISCQSSKELWVMLRDGCCGTSLEIKKTDGSDRHSSSAVLSHFRYDPSKFWSVSLLHHKTLSVYKWLHNLKAICNCLINFASKYVCRVFWGNMYNIFGFVVTLTFPSKPLNFNILNMCYLKWILVLFFKDLVKKILSKSTTK